MTQNNFRNNFYKLIVKESPAIKMIMLFEAAIKSEAIKESIKIDDEPDNSFRLSAVFYHAILSEMALRAKPTEETDLKISEFLQRFL